MQRSESKICDWVLACDERIQFAMAIDELGNTLCQKSLGLYSLPSDTALRLAEMMAVLATGILKDMATHHGDFQHLVIKHERFATIGLKISQGYLIFVARDESVPEVITRVRETLATAGK